MVPGSRDRRSVTLAMLSVLVSGLDAELRRLGYKESTWSGIGAAGAGWRGLRRARGRGVLPDVAMAWVDAACGGFFDKERAGTLSDRCLLISGLPDAGVRGMGAGAARYSKVGEQVGRRRRRGGSPGSPTRCGPLIARCRRCGLYERWRRSSSHSRPRGWAGPIDAGVLGFVATLADIRPRRSSRRCCGAVVPAVACGRGLVDARRLDASRRCVSNPG